MDEYQIPLSNWLPLSPADVLHLFAKAPFTWAISGGYVIEQFLGRSIREHGDIDVVVFRDEQLQVQSWLAGWQLYAADPPGTLRQWHDGEYLPYGIQDIMGHRLYHQSWELQIMLNEGEADQWYMRRNREINGSRADIVAMYNGIPCVRVDVQLLHKAHHCLPKDTLDFQACLPYLSVDARQWLKDNLRLLYPGGHAWLEALL